MLHLMFGKLVNDNVQRNWCELVLYVTYAYNTTSHGTTSFSPFYLMYLRRARTPIELQYDLSQMQYENEDAYVSEASERMRKAFQVVRKQLKTNFEQAKRCYDQRVKSTKFHEHEFVWHFIPHTKKGLNKK